MMEIAGGPPIITGIPLGIASTVDEGSRTGSPQLIDLSPIRTALVPITLTVWEPNTLMASPSGATGGLRRGRFRGRSAVLQLQAALLERARRCHQSPLAIDRGQRARDLGGAGRLRQLGIQLVSQVERALPAVDRRGLDAPLQGQLASHAPGFDRQNVDLRFF